MKKIAIVLSGCGNQDGTEITEAVSLIVSLTRLGSEIQFFAPDLEFTPQDHQLRQPAVSEKRNVFKESARIARGNIHDIKILNAKNFDGLAFPGGFGAALRLSDWGQRGADGEVIPEVKRVILDFFAASKPIAAICIAPVLLAKVLGDQGITVTLGENGEVSTEVEKTGALHESCPVDDFITDREFKIVTSPAYMYDGAKPHEVFIGIEKLAKEFVEMA